MVAHGLVDDLPAVVGFAHPAFIEFAVEIVKLALELTVVVETIGIDYGVGDGATRFSGVTAIAETAVLGDPLYVFEGGVEVGGRGPQLDFAQTWHVDEQPAGGQDEHGSSGSGVAAAIVVLAHFACGVARLAEEPVDKGGLADAGGANEGCCFAGGDKLVELFDAEASAGADGKNWYTARRGEAVQYLVQIDAEVSGEVGFIKQDHGTGAALLGEDEISLDAALIEIAIEAVDDEQNIDVGGERLILSRLARLFAGKEGPAFKDMVDDGCAGTQGNPIADGGPCRGIVAELSTDESFELAHLSPDDETVSGSGRYAGRYTGALLDGEKAIPAKVL